MPKIKFIFHDGNETTVAADNGYSLMHVAVDHGIPGIDADCSGNCSCATCHVYIDERWLDKLEKPALDEERLINLSPDKQNNSRLSCQITIADELDGLEVRLPEYQF